MNEPKLRVGIMYEPEITFCLNDAFRLKQNGKNYSGTQKISYENDKIRLAGEDLLLEELTFEPVQYNSASFDLFDVTIGIQFHWERKENQKFKGSLKIICENNKLTAINIIPLEDYLISVISSEMSATSCAELLKAHAVVSRGWLLAQIEKRDEVQASGSAYRNTVCANDELIRWYDREDHLNFDVCADDHCQRYQGITRASTGLVEKAITETRGIILMYQGKICDARFSKSCGGVSESFANVWEPVNHSYLQAITDNPVTPHGFDMNLTNEAAAQKWIRNQPEAFCNTNDKEILSQILNDYDQETMDFYRWKVSYSQKEISALIAKKTGTDFGDIMDLIPVERGESGRLIKLKIVGVKKTLIIGKELEIRKTLSESHLYSSAIVIDKKNMVNKIPGRFEIIGAGWGHGVGLCQIGAAVMGSRGYRYKHILHHYFTGATLQKHY